MYKIRYTGTRFAAGFLSASVVAVCLGALIGLSRPLYQAFNSFIQMLKPISSLAWMPLLLYTVKNPTWAAILVVFLTSLWPTVANTAFGMSTMRKDYWQVASLLQLSWWQRLMRAVNLPRPRTREAMIDTHEYTRLRRHILHFLMRGSHALATPDA